MSRLCFVTRSRAALFVRGEDAKGLFFTRHAELKPLYDAYVASADPVETKRSALLAALHPGLASRRRVRRRLG